jgi:hypothetical protein
MDRFRRDEFDLTTAASYAPNMLQIKPAHAQIAVKLKMRRWARSFALRPAITHDKKRM